MTRTSTRPVAVFEGAGGGLDGGLVCDVDLGDRDREAGAGGGGLGVAGGVEAPHLDLRALAGEASRGAEADPAGAGDDGDAALEPHAARSRAVMIPRSSARPLRRPTAE